MKPSRNRTMREPGSQLVVPNQVPILHQSDLQHSDLGEITAEKQDRSRTRQRADKGYAGLGTGAGNRRDPLRSTNTEGLRRRWGRGFGEGWYY